MNFFAHALVAQRISEDPSFVLGAMLPDLAHMCGARPARAGAAVEAGIAHHHEADGTFHAGAAFVALLVQGSRDLRALGVPRGGALGAAHVAIELALDGALAQHGPGRRAFARALASADALDVEWPDPAAAARWRALCARLRDGALPARYREPRFLCDRVTGLLANRPRLALDARATEALHTLLPALQRRVTAEADALVGAAARAPLAASPRGTDLTSSPR